jgi:hypothetical protein
MVICAVQGPSEVGPWKQICSFEQLQSLSRVKAVPHPAWRERVIENALLRQPEVLAGAVGIAPTERSVVLKQVNDVDLYLRTDAGLHLFEVKPPRARNSWIPAATQIARQWAASSHWMRPGTEPVYLWALCPTRWKGGRPELPDGWLADLGAIGAPGAVVGLIHYSFLDSSIGPAVVFWRHNEPQPVLNWA